MMSTKQLFIGFPSKKLTPAAVEEYLTSVLTCDYSIKKGKNKGKRKPTKLILSLSNESDFNILTQYKHLVEGVELRIQPFLTKEERTRLVEMKLSRRVYINGLPLAVQHEDVFKLFQTFGKIEEIFIKNKSESKKKGKKRYVAAFVTFETLKGFQRCAKATQGRLMFKKGGCMLRLMKSISLSAGSKHDDSLVELTSPKAGLTQKRTQMHHSEDGFKGSMQASTVELNMPFVSLRKDDQHKNDWMGQAIKEKFRLSKVVRGGPQRSMRCQADLSRMRFRGNNLKFNPQRTSCGGW